MNATGRSTVIGVFHDWGWAEKAIDELHHRGFTDEQMGLVRPGGEVTPVHTATGVLEENAGEGAVRGAVTGGAVGAVAGALATGLIPGVGPVIAGGLLLGILGGAATGAAVGTFAGPFIALGFTEDEARHYQNEVHAGRTLLAVQAGDRQEEVREVFRRYNATERRSQEIPAAAGSR